MRPKYITTYLVDWDPTWIKTIELSWRIWKWLIVPRAKLKESKTREEMKQPAIYFLFWLDEDWNNLAYIWEAENIFNRLVNHDSNKDFRDIAIIFVSKWNDLAKWDVKFLESKAIEKAKKINRYILQNSTEPTQNSLPEYQISAMEEFLDNIDLLISAVWYPILKEFNIKNLNKKQDLYFCKWPEANATWYYSSEWLLVLEWSKARIELSNTAWSRIQNIQNKLLTKNIIKKDSEKSFVFIQDYLFNSPSAAAGLILSRRSNWRKDRKDEKWKTLDENERKSLK